VTKVKLAVISTVLICSATAASADVIDWAVWQSATAGPVAGSALGTTSSGLTIGYNGELQTLSTDVVSWQPATSWIGGNIDNAPLPSGGTIGVNGGSAVVDIITFSAPVTNPVMAFWSLGNPGYTAEFDFTSLGPFAIQAGGPNAEYGGQSIIQSGNRILGAEGNGAIQFFGTFSQISWTNPVYEGWYGFTVGVAAVPEPSTWAMLLIGFASVGFMAYRRRNPKQPSESFISSPRRGNDATMYKTSALKCGSVRGLSVRQPDSSTRI